MKKHLASRVLFSIALSSGCAVLSGCSVTQRAEEPIKISAVRQPPADLQTITLTINRSDYVRALESSRGAGSLRVVPMVVSAAQAPTTPEYRLFNIRKGSVAELIGLENSDILVAAHDFVVRSPNQFYNYLNAVPKEKHSQIEIRRGNKPLLISFDFADG